MRRRTLLGLSVLAVLPALGARGAPLSPELRLTAEDLVEGADALQLRPGLALPVAPPGLPPVDPADTGPEAGLLRRALVQGRASGLAGVVYDNRDRGHSALAADLFPPMTRLVYGPDLVAQDLDYGLALPVLLPAGPQPADPAPADLPSADPALPARPALAPVIGNSSTAIVGGAAPRSLPRLAMTMPGGPERAFAGYAGNQTWVYPEHHDHDAADLFPANWPYMLISQGSSRSDRPFLRAAGLILGALPPATRASAEARGLIGPTVQMLFRRGRQRGALDYLSGAAHPTVFDGKALNAVAMMQLAGALGPEDLPPLVRLEVLAESFTASAGLAGMSERLFDTPSAIARIWRGPGFSREMLVGTGATEQAGAVARWHWVLLRGDPARVRIVPQGGRARIGIDWQEARPIPPAQGDAAPARTSGRVDIGVFAEMAGGQISAPAFVSVSFPLHEIRRYGPAEGAGQDGAMRLLSVDYDAVGRGIPYDPWLDWSAPWRDSFAWAADGSPAGWTRTATSPAGAGAAGDYDAAGLRDGRPVSYDRAGAPRQPVLQLR